jgi:hypothetical protein
MTRVPRERGGEADHIRHKHGSQKKKQRYACRSFGTNSFKEGAMWHVDPLLGNDRETHD